MTVVDTFSRYVPVLDARYSCRGEDVVATLHRVCGKIGFTTAPVTVEVQLLVNLGLVHRDSEWQTYWEGCAHLVGGGLAGMSGIRGQACQATGTAAWPRHTSSFSISTTPPHKPHKTVPSKHAGQTLGGGGLRGADGTVHAKAGAGNAIQSHRIPDSAFRIMCHKGGLGAAGSHPAVFPVALVEAVLTAFSHPGDLIYEPFCGSSTQIIAAEPVWRRCFAAELDPVYCDVAVRQ